jgi:hypothetical protein
LTRLIRMTWASNRWPWLCFHYVVNTPFFWLFFANFLPHLHNPPTLIWPPSVSRQCRDDDGLEDDDGIDCSNGGAMIFGGVGVYLLPPGPGPGRGVVGQW